MQTTLLGLAIAVILALVAALAGPLMIDWGNHRSLFEAEASRLIGVKVGVTGDIEARLLPSPRLRLHGIEIGNGADTVRARSLGIEFALGPLMRGEWRAAEMHLAGPKINLGLDGSGHVRAPNITVAFNPDELSIDRLSIEDGKITLADVASAASITLDRLWFNGEARSLVGPVKGEGAVTIDGRLYPFRVSAGRLSDEGTLKLRINVDPVDHLLSIEADGALAFTGSAPRFDGTLSLSRPVGIKSRGAAQSAQGPTQPWRVSGKIKATGQSALIQDLEFQFGSEEQGVRLAGVADFKFGKRPRFDGVLSGRQIDLDRAVSSGDSVRQPPAAVIRKLAELGAAAFRPALPIQIGIGIDQLTLGGNSVQNLRGDISSSGGGWDLDRFEFRAPGFTQVRLSGRLAVGAEGVAFTGPAEVDASDPKALAAWLEGRAEGGGQSDLRPLSLRGDLTLASDKVAIERLRAEFDRKPVTGHLAYFFASGNQPAKLDAEIKAAELDIDSATAFGRALVAGSTLERPQEMTIAAEIGRATVAGIDVRDARARFTIDGRGLQVDRLSAADFGGGSFAASGRIDTAGQAPRGVLAVDFETKRAGAIVAVVNKFAPNRAGTIASLFDRVGHAKLHAKLDISGEGQTSSAVARLTLAGDIDGMRLDTLALAHGDWENRSIGNIRINGTIDAPDGAALTKLMGLDWLVATGKGPGQLKVQVVGPANREMTLDVWLSANGLSTQAHGRGQLSEDQGAKIAATLQVPEADLRPLRSDAVAGSTPLPLKLTSRIAIAGSATTFDDINAKLGGTSIRGRLAIDNNIQPRRIDGTLEADAADVTALIARAVGMAPQVSRVGAAGIWSSEPFGNGVLNELTGKVALKFLRADLWPKMTARNLRATLVFGEDELVLDHLICDLAGGRFSGRIAFHGAKGGMIARAKVSLAGADAATLLSMPARPPVTGSLSFAADVEGTGLSPVALIGSLQGSGKITLTDGQFAGLDPRAFDAVTRSVDQGLAIEIGRVSDVVSKSLGSGQLSLKHAEATIAISAGQLRLSNVTAETKGAMLSVSSALDLTDGSLDARLVLSGSAEAAGARPDIFMALKGPFMAPSRNIDVSALTGWLTLRAVENQTKRLRAIENIPAQPRERPLPKNMKAPSLPAPIYVRPAPSPRSAGQPAAPFGSQN